jgi:hypothetical protein
MMTTPFDSEAGYHAGIALILAGAQRELRIFDRNLMAMGLEERERVDALFGFLAADKNHLLRIAVHDIAPLQARQPRLLALLRSFSHQVDIRITPERLRDLAECWLLADASNGVIRFHADQARGKTVLALPAEIEPWWQKADELIAESKPCIPWAVVGL